MTLNEKAYHQLLDEDLEWLLKTRRTLERDHTEMCLKWLRKNYHKVKDIDMKESRRENWLLVRKARNTLQTATHRMGGFTQEQQEDVERLAQVVVELDSLLSQQEE